MKITINTLREKKEKGEPISWLVAYDYFTARAAEMAEIQMLLCGDSGSSCLLGNDSTNNVTTEEMLIFNKSVRNGAKSLFLVSDFVSGSFEESDAQAVQTAFKFVKNCNCEAVKVEGGKRVESRIRAIVNAGVSVISHIGLQPQSLATIGGYKTQGKSLATFEKIVEDTESAINAGAFAVLIEGTPEEITNQIMKRFGEKIIIFTIGGGKSHGQLLLAADLLGTVNNVRPSFAKCYTIEAMHQILSDTQHLKAKEFYQYGKDTKMDGFFALQIAAFKQYAKEVKEGIFPSEQYNYKLKPEELSALQKSKLWIA